MLWAMPRPAPCTATPILDRRLSRRRLLRAAGAGAAGLAGAALVGCADDGDAGVSVVAATETPPPPPTSTSGVTRPPVRNDGTLRLHLGAPPASLDPYASGTPETRTVAAHLYGRLFRVTTAEDRDPWSTGVEPDLAEGIETADGRTWIVTLRPDARFHDVAPVDGRAVTAEDVVASFQRLAAVDSPGAALVRHWTQVTATDERTVQFTLARPHAAFPDELADVARLLVLPQEALAGEVPPSVVAGSGPWLLDEFDPDRALRLRANPATSGGAPFMERLELAFLDDGDALEGFRAGDLHLSPVRADAVLPLRVEQREVQWRRVLSPVLSFLFFSPTTAQSDDPWRDERFRQAVSLLQDRDALTEVGYNLGAFAEAGMDAPVRWNNLVPAGFTRWWLDPTSADQGDSARFFRHDPTEARRLLDAVEYAGEEIPFVLPAGVYGATFEAIADALVASLREGGLNLRVERQDFASEYLLGAWRGGFRGIAFGHQTAFEEVGDYFTRMFGTGETNHGRVRDAAIDDLVERQAEERDEAQRRALIVEIQRLNAERMYYVPSQAGAGYQWTAYRPELSGIRQTRGLGAGREVHPYLSIEA